LQLAPRRGAEQTHPVQRPGAAAVVLVRPAGVAAQQAMAAARPMEPVPLPSVLVVSAAV
jgi:hypothetical protein